MKRREAREQAFNLVFQQNINHGSIDEIITDAEESEEIRVDPFAENEAKGVESHLDEIDEIISRYTKSWKMNRLSKVCISLLRLCIYEMKWEEEIPVSVSINEAVDLAKKYGGAEDPKFLNGVLGSVAKEWEQHD